ncbi:hypothetical protein ABEY65_28060 [Priestia aryabhattai]|uniref:hypothetical protein n=1 Tax=Priestia aryabhattai TaxID=412384 RepID=UPI003D2D1197
MEKVKAYQITEEEFTDVTGGIENVKDMFSWGGFFLSQSEGFNGKKLYFVIHHFLMIDEVEPKYFLVTPDFVEEIGLCVKHEKKMVDELMLSILLEYGILKI